MALIMMVACGGMVAAQDRPGSDQSQNNTQENASQPGSADASDSKREPPDAAPSDDDRPDDAPESKPEAPAAKPDRIEDLNLRPRALQEALRGRPRDIPEVLKIVNRKVTEPTTAKERNDFDKFRRLGDQKTPEDLALIEKVTREQVYALTDPAKLETIGKTREVIEKVLDTGNEKFRQVYKLLLRKYLAELLDNHLSVRLNAVILLAKLNEESLIPLFVSQINDPDQHDVVKHCSVKGIMLIAQQPQGIADVKVETEAVGALLDLLKRNEPIHPFTRLRIVQALGSIGRPTRGAIVEDAEVAVALLRVARDPGLRRNIRWEAVLALGNLRIPPELDFNFQYLAYEIALFAADTARAALAATHLDDGLHADLFLAYCYLVMEGNKQGSLSVKARAHAAAAAHKDAVYIQALGEEVKKLPAMVLPIFKGQTEKDLGKKLTAISKGLQDSGLNERIKGLEEYLGAHPPRSMRITPNSRELDPPPALANPRGPVEKTDPQEPKAEEPEAGEAETP